MTDPDDYDLEMSERQKAVVEGCACNDVSADAITAPGQFEIGVRDTSTPPLRSEVHIDQPTVQDGAVLADLCIDAAGYEVKGTMVLAIDAAKELAAAFDSVTASEEESTESDAPDTQHHTDSS